MPLDEIQSLDRAQDLELRGRGRHAVYRRIALALMALFALAALLDVFGQESTTTVAAGRSATLTVLAPTRLRGGLLFQARFEIHATRPLSKPRLVLSPEWLEAMTLNTLEPSPIAEDSSSDGLSLTFEPLQPGGTLNVWTDWQVNPTNVGVHDNEVTLYDGPKPIATADRDVTVFP
jgi:hypothetical protein